MRSRYPRNAELSVWRDRSTRKSHRYWKRKASRADRRAGKRECRATD